MPTCSGPHHGLSSSNLASVAYQLAMKPNRIQYSLAVASPALPTVDDYSPLFVPPRHFHFNEYHAITTATTFNCAVNFLLPPTYYVSWRLAASRPTRVFRPTHIISIAPTHIPIFLLLSLYPRCRIPRGLARNPRSPNKKFSSFSSSKTKGVFQYL